MHTSIAGGLYKSVERAAALGCGCMQIFGRNPRSWIYNPLPAHEAGLFRAARKEASLWPVAVHTNYLINLCSPDDGIYYKSIDIFQKELGIAEAIGMGSDFAIRRVGQALKEAARGGLGIETMILLENTSGAGYGFGSDLLHIGEIIKGAASDGRKIGLCLDTCHAFTAGYSFSRPVEVAGFLKKIDEAVGLENLKVIHLNDSKGAFHSNLDRHEHIGKGKIGLEAFRLLLNHPDIREIPMILETPKKTDKDDPMNLATVRGLLD
ncbi:MAG: deoxyribonuclease IV [Deltaproteobacteria bacterium]|nr:deoxyribonuclease IV [Deltaproteobacteria bacterium]